jgi:hypothetical protein
MTTHRAIAIADGIQQPTSTDEFVEAYQTLADTGTAWMLPDRIIAMLEVMIEEGDVKLASNYQPNKRKEQSNVRLKLHRKS